MALRSVYALNSITLHKISGMTIAVLANETLRKAWEQKGYASDVELLWCGSVRSFVATVADAYIDLEFTADPERTQLLKQREHFPLFINAPQYSCKNLGVDFIRINAWPGFFERDLVELVAISEERIKQAARVMEALQWKWIGVKDIEGMIAARVIISIINEAYHTEAAGISSRQDIDTAMKLGTGYPFGPFEWAKKIGLENVYELLRVISTHNKIYAPSISLKTEMDQLTKS